MTAIEMTSVGMRFGDVTALSGVDLVIDQGELVAVLGPNGAGKTTMFEIVLGLITPTTGRARTLGHPSGHRAALTRTGAMLQDAGLPENVTVRELVELIAASYPRNLGVEETLRRVGLSSRSDRKVTVLSGGEHQRLLLAMAIVGIPDLLLLDEPTAAMDAESRRSFWDEARAAVDDGTTLVFATHDLAEADVVAQRVIVIQEGSVVADTTPDEMKLLVSPKTVSLRTTVGRAELENLPGSGQVEMDDVSRRIRIHTSTPELVVAGMVERGHPIDDLLVAEAALEEAFVSLLAARERP